MASPRDDLVDLAQIEAAYRKALFTIVGHAIFLIACCVFAVLLRRLFKMPPALLTTALVVALLVFGGDLLRFLSYRRRLQRLRDEYHS